MLSTLTAAIRVSLLRTRADWLIVAAAWLITVLAVTLLAAGPIYAGAVSIAGLQRVLADAPVDEANVQVRLRAAPEEVAEVDGVVRGELQAALAPIGGEIAQFARSDSFTLPGQPAGEVRDLAVIGFSEAIEEHVALVAGSWPQDVSPPAAVPVAVTEAVADAFSIGLGEQLTLPSRIHENLVVPVRIVGILRIGPSDPYWWDEPLVADGVESSDRYATYGPFFTTAANMLSRATAGRVQLGWRALGNFDALRVGKTEPLRAGVAALHDRITSQVSGSSSVTVTTRLPEILAAAERSLLVSRTGVLVLIAQLAILAAYAILLTAALLVDHRRVETALLRSRGARPGQIGTLAVAEGLLLTVPAALAGPWLAAAALELLNVTGPLAEIGLRIRPVVTRDAQLVAAIAAAACLLALALPPMLAARSFVAAHGAVSRAETRTIGQRLGIDLALLAVAGIGFWQLRHYGAPLTETIHGTLGLDPLLVAAPAIGLLAGAVLALRLVPMLAALIEGAVAGGRGLVSALGARQLARRPLRYTRAALLLMLAMSMGVFAISYTRTWTTSQRDQAAFQVGADVRVSPGTRADAFPRWGLDEAYAAIDGVDARMPVAREQVQISRAAGSGELLGLDAAVASSVVAFRPDLADARLADLIAPLADGSPQLTALPLAGEPVRARIGVTLAIEGLTSLVFYEEVGFVPEPVDPSVLADWQGIRGAVVVRDARGLLHDFEGPWAAFGDGTVRLSVPIGGPAAATAALSYPLELVAIQVELGLPERMEATDATLILSGIDTAAAGGRWQPVSLAPERGWRISAAWPGARPIWSPLTGLTAPMRDEALPHIPFLDRGRGMAVSFVAAGIGDVVANPTPVVVNRPFLEATAASPGDLFSLRIDGVQRDIVIAGAVDAFPATDPARPLVLMHLPALQLLQFHGNHDHRVDPPAEWWLDVAEGQQAAVATALERPPIFSRGVTSLKARSRSLATDPVALGIMGALTVGFAAAVIFALIGFMVSAAVSARERLTEFALLRALGLSRGQLSGWLSLENTTLVVVSMVAGSGLGLLLAWVVLPFVTVTQQAATPMPPVEVQIPWGTVVALEVLSALALVIAVLALAWLLRRVGLGSVLRMGED